MSWALSPPAPRGASGPSDIQRIRVVDTLAEAGFAPEQLSELPRPQPGQVLRADDDELLRQAVPALEGFGGEETAPVGPRPTWPAGWSRSSASSPTAAAAFR